VDLTYIHAAAGGDSNDVYHGLDRFGRVVEQWWIKDETIDLDRFQYGYDRNGNRQYRDNLVHGDFSELYHAGGVVDTYDGQANLITAAYDRLGQLSPFARGFGGHLTDI
jgi:hypothetical protein